MKGKWEDRTIGDVCTVIAGQSPKGSAYNHEGEGLPFYQGKKHFGEMYIHQATTWTRIITKEAEAGDILMSVRAPVGPINFATEKSCIGRGLAAIRPGKDIDRMYLFYWLLFKQSEIKGNEGAVFASINKKQIESLSVQHPSLPEQNRIVTILDEAFSGIDSTIANTKKNLTNARELFESYLNVVFGRNGENLENTTLADACRFFNGKAHEKIIDENGKYILINSKFISTGGANYKSSSENLFPLFSGDIAMVMSDVPKGKTLAKCFLVDKDCTYSLNQRICCIRSDVFDSKFLFYQLNRNPYLLAFDNKENQTNLRKGNILKCPLWLPSLDRQQKIVSKIDDFLGSSSSLVSTYQRKLTALSELKQSLLQKAFSGELSAKATDKATDEAIT